MSEEDRSSPLYLASIAHQKSASKPNGVPDRPISRSVPNFQKEIKVIVIGCSAVGKTALVRREAFGEFDGAQSLTLGTERLVTKVEIHDEVIELALYDTVGQERFMTISTTLYRNAQAILICFDCSNRASFESVDRWYADVERNTPQDALILLIATKVDLPRAVSAEECKQKAAQMGIHLVETSAKTGHNVKALFALVATTLAGDRRLRATSSLVHTPISAPPSPLGGPSRYGGIRIDRPASSPATLRRSYDVPNGNGIQLPPVAPSSRHRRRSSSTATDPSKPVQASAPDAPKQQEPSSCWSGVSLSSILAYVSSSSNTEELSINPLLRGASYGSSSGNPVSPSAGPTMMPIPTPDDGLSLAEVLVEHASLRARTLAGGLRRRNTIDQHQLNVNEHSNRRLHASSSVMDGGIESPTARSAALSTTTNHPLRDESLYLDTTAMGLSRDDDTNKNDPEYRMCTLGCGAVLEKYRSNHESEECWLRLVPCSLGCGSSFPMLDCVAHEREGCKLRTVRCQCGTKTRAEQIVDHVTAFKNKSISLWTNMDTVHFILSVFAREQQRKMIDFAKILRDKIDGKQLLNSFRMNSGTVDIVGLIPDAEMRKTLHEAMRNFSFVASSSSSLQSMSTKPASPVRKPMTTSLFPSHNGEIVSGNEYYDFDEPEDGSQLPQSASSSTSARAVEDKRNPAMIEQNPKTRMMFSLGIVSAQRRLHMLAPHHLLLNHKAAIHHHVRSSSKLSDGDEAAGIARSDESPQQNNTSTNASKVLVEELDEQEVIEKDKNDSYRQRSSFTSFLTVKCQHGNVQSSCGICTTSAATAEFSQLWNTWYQESLTKDSNSASSMSSSSPKNRLVEEESTREVLVPLSFGSRTVAVKTVRFSDLQLVSQDLVGAGSFGAVYLGRYRGAQVAVKHLHYQGIAERDLLREAAVMTSVSGHPHVLRFLGVCLERPNISFVSEALQCSLEDWLRHDRMDNAEPLSEILRFAEEAASGVYHLHLEMVVHRDIAARNLLFDSGNPKRVKVCDFGLARVLPRRSHAGGDAVSQFAVLNSGMAHPPATMGGGSLNLAGPLRWMSPESLRPGGDGLTRFSFASDVYSFAITVWELLSRDVPYSTLQPHEAAIAVMMENLRPPRARMPKAVAEQLNQLLINGRVDTSNKPSTTTVSPPSRSNRQCVTQLVALLERAWEKDPVNRPTMRELVNELSVLRATCCEEAEEQE